MSKLDWVKVGLRDSDPARAIRDHRDTTLANTPTARKEAKQKAKARSKVAAQAAKTRKLNRQRQQETIQKAAGRSSTASIAEEHFWAQLKARMASTNEKRRARLSQTTAPVNGLGKMLGEALAERKT